MANKYWIANQTSASAVSANVDANWNDTIDGSGSTGKPGASDIAIIGHPTTAANNKGFADISWDITNVGGLVISNGYTYDLSTTKTVISFTGTLNNINLTDGAKWDDIGFKVGMWVTIAGSTSNNGSTYVTAINNEVMTVNQALTTEAAGDTVTISTTMSLDVAGNFECDYISLNGTIKNSSGASKVITLDGNFQDGANNRYILNGASAQILNQDILTYKYNGNAGSQPTAVSGDATIYFDDGPYPNVQIFPALDLSCDYHASPTSAEHGEVSMYSFTVTNASSTMNPTDESPKNNSSKVFKLQTTGFTYAPTVVDVGFSKWIFTISSSAWIFPVTGSSSYGAGDGLFEAYWHNIQLETATAGYAATLESGRTLSVNALTVESDAIFRGEPDKSNPSSTIVSVSRPNIKGAWNFSQVADGVYASVISNAYPITPSHGAGGRVQLSANGGKFTSDAKLTWTSATSTLLVNGKLDVTGLIDPTGMQFDRQATNPGTADTVWVNNSGALMFGASAVGGGGGSGTVTNIATSAPITGGAITTTGTIGISAATTSAAGSMSSADKTKLDGIAASATAYTDAAAIAAVEGESTLVLQSGVTVGTNLKMTTSSNNAIIENVTQDKDIIFQVNDGGVTTEVMRIDAATSRVGIGETFPDAPLHIKGSTAGTILKVETTSNTSMSPDIEFYNGMAPVAGNNIGNIEFNGRNELTVGANNGTAFQYARIYAGIDSVAGSTVDGTEASRMGFQINTQGANKTMLFMEGHPTGGGFITFNYNGEDMDFRVHGEDTNNLFFINGGSGNEGVGVGGVTTPKSMFTVDGTITLKEQAAADSDSTAYGQIWVKTGTPNELYFTTAAGNDIQLTSGTSIAGGGGGSGDVVGPSSATNNNFVAFDGTTGKLVKDSAKGAADFATAAQGVLAASSLQPGTAGLDAYNPLNPAFWGGFGPPPDIQEAIQRIAQQLVALGGPIP